MSYASTESFLEGTGISVPLPEIEAELAKLWGPAAEQVSGPEIDSPNVTRIVLANLLVEGLAADCGALGPVLESVIGRFPCRAIVVRGTDDPERQVLAEISAVCHLPAPGLPQVCSERIVLRAGPRSIELIPGAVRPLLEADLPLILWWTGDPRRHEALFRNLADECSRVILDLPDPGAPVGALRLGLDPSLCPSSRDTAWLGLARWRELVAQFFDPGCHHESLKRISSVRLEVVSPEPSRPPRLAIWLAAWLAGQLGWQPLGRPLKLGSASESTVQATFQGPAHPITVEIATRPIPPGIPVAPRLMDVTITAQGPDGLATFRLRRSDAGSPAVRVEAHSPDSCHLPRIVNAPELEPAQRIAAGLESSRVDPPFQNALPIAMWLME
ncbi:MAG TPA: glucose-6-phosphate dehydrogenase assembly protein OpcA [Isosphaeraceae bacterium]|nr:glucose-6-phosphate dehydrogenase assembly protein OpcA [Isosphaeraceae bacterium]